MDFLAAWETGHVYDDFLAQYGASTHRERWKNVFDQVVVTVEQMELLRRFTREMKVLCLAGAWCGDCAEQCPILQKFAELAPRISLRFLDRDAIPEVRDALSICGGKRVPVVVILSEDGHEVVRFGDRTLSRYRRLAAQQIGSACPTGISVGTDPQLALAVQEWLEVLERAQLVLRLSPRLREKHGD